MVPYLSPSCFQIVSCFTENNREMVAKTTPGAHHMDKNSYLHLSCGDKGKEVFSFFIEIAGYPVTLFKVTCSLLRRTD